MEPGNTKPEFLIYASHESPECCAWVAAGPENVCLALSCSRRRNRVATPLAIQIAQATVASCTIATKAIGSTGAIIRLFL